VASALLLALLPLGVGAATGTAPGTPGTTYGSLQAARAEEAALASQLAGVDLALVQAQARLASLQAQAAADRSRELALYRRAAALQATLAGERGALDGVLRFLYEGGLLSFATVLLQAGNFADFLTRLTYIEDILTYDSRVMRNVEAHQRSLAAAQAAAAAAGRRVAQDVSRSQAELADLTQLRRSHAAALAQAQRRATQLGQVLTSLDAALLGGLPALTYLLDHFAGLPWSSINPDSERLDLGTRTVVAVFDQGSVDQVLAQAPQLHGLQFQIASGRVEVASQSSGIVLSGPMVPAGLDSLRWKPDSLEVGGAPAPSSLLQALLRGRDLAFAIPTPVSQVHLLRASEEPGKLDLTFGF
jgi:hypothetical protein